MVFGLSLEEASRLHGHKGPWLVIGYRAGSRAREVLKPKTEHDLKCVVRIPKEIPYTCTVDGIQASTSCTLGKLNISIEESEDFEFIFINRVTGKSLTLKLREDVKDRVEELSSKSGMSVAAKWVEEVNLWELFEEFLR